MEILKYKLAYEKLISTKIEKQYKNYNSLCWESNYSKSSNGYGQIWVNNKPWNIHRLSFFVNNNCIPLLEKHHICHKCDNKGCFNPNHLYQGTASDNAIEAQERNETLINRKKEKIYNMNPCDCCIKAKCKCIYDPNNDEPCKRCIDKNLECIVDETPNKKESTATFKKGDHKGENNIKAKLKESQVKEIRERFNKVLKYGELKKMAEEYDIKYITIQKIVSNKIWTDI